MLTMAISDNGQ